MFSSLSLCSSSLSQISNPISWTIRIHIDIFLDGPKYFCLHWTCWSRVVLYSLIQLFDDHLLNAYYYVPGIGLNLGVIPDSFLFHQSVCCASLLFALVLLLPFPLLPVHSSETGFPLRFLLPCKPFSTKLSEF